MKKLFPDMPDVPQSVANRAVRIVEKHLRTHRVTRVRDLPEEAKIRLYRDLRLFFEGDPQSPAGDGEKQSFTLRGFLSRMWEKLEDFLSAFDSGPGCTAKVAVMWAAFGESARLAVFPLSGGSPACERST